MRTSLLPPPPLLPCTKGWSAASLANLMNEAAILTVSMGARESIVERTSITASPHPSPLLSQPLPTYPSPIPKPLPKPNSQVRRNVERISLPMALELVEGIDWGARAPRIPNSEAKNRCVFRRGKGGGGLSSSKFKTQCAKLDIQACSKVGGGCSSIILAQWPHMSGPVLSPPCVYSSHHKPGG